MAQLNTKVTDFFVSRKRISEARPLKRQKLSDVNDAFSKPHQCIQDLTKTGGTQRPRRNSKVAVKSSNRKSNTKSYGTQLTLSDSLKCLTEKDKHSSQLQDSQAVNPSEAQFNFKANAVVSSDCDSVVRVNDTNDSPRSTPTKRSSNGKSLAAKRKRATAIRDVTPESDSDKIDADRRAVARKKLDMPPSEQINSKTKVASKSTRKDTQSTIDISKARVANSDIVKNDAAKPDAIKPAAGRSKVAKPDAIEPGTVKPDAIKPGTVKLDAIKPGTVKPDDIKPGSAKPDAIKPAAGRSGVTKPEAIERGTVKPDAAKHDALKSDALKPGVEKPDAIKPDAEKLKAKLSKCGKLSDLKACLQSVRDLKARIKDKKDNSETVCESAESAPKSRSTPAYEKYKDLAVKIPPTLTLPYKYKVLEDMFKGADTVISIMYNRVERCTFDKLKRAVQDMIRKNFEPKHLGQIKSVFPESYELRQEVGIVEAGVKSKKYQLTVEPVLEVPKKGVQVAKRKDGRPVFGSGEVGRRKESFRRRLFDIVKSHHQSFLEKLKPSVKVDPQKLTRWHPQFLLEDVPEVQPSPLPEAPETEKEPITAKDVLSKVRGKVPCKVEQALQKVADATEKANNLRNLKKTAEENKMNVEKGATGAKPSADAKPLISNKTAGISSALLDRIRAKESLKAKAAMLRDERTEQEMEILGRLPEMIKILRSHFITEKKAALTEDSVIVKLTDSYKSSISQGSVEKHVDYLLECLPDWISRVSISTGKYIKINRQTELSQLDVRLKELLRQKQYHIPDLIL